MADFLMADFFNGRMLLWKARQSKNIMLFAGLLYLIRISANDRAHITSSPQKNPTASIFLW